MRPERPLSSVFAGGHLSTVLVGQGAEVVRTAPFFLLSWKLRRIGSLHGDFSLWWGREGRPFLFPADSGTCFFGGGRLERFLDGERVVGVLNGVTHYL